MNSLLGYGSDNDFDDSSDEKQTDWRTTPAKKTFDNSEDGGNRQLKQSDVNYDEVQMDLSEESNDSCPKTREKSSDHHHHHHHRNNHRDHRSSNSRHRSRSSDRDRNRRLDDNRSNRDRYDNKYRNSTTGNSRDLRDKRSQRSLSKDRRNRNNSRSPSSRKSSRSRSRSRSKSRSKDINRKSVNNDRTNDLLQKQIQSSQQQQKPAFITTVPTITPLIQTTTTTRITRPTLPIIQQTTSQINNRGDDDRRDDRFFMPGITGRFREQIERRKLLWQKKDTTNNPTKINTGVTKKVWETTTFAQDTDGKVANKFKRLMGIKNTTDDRNGSTVDVLKKQEEMFSSMEQQYEVARTATHTMRGVGLGFSSNYPR